MKPEGKRPPVEELSDLQWARVERGLWTRLDAEPALSEAMAPSAEGARAWARRRWRPLAIGGAMAMAAAVTLLLLLGDRGAEGELVGRGDPPARVMTSDSATTISFADVAIEVAPHSALLMSGSATRGATIVLERGRAGFRVAPREAHAPFVVVAGAAMVGVVGTTFEVARDGESITVGVQEGQVDVRYLGRVQRVVAGDQWSSSEASKALSAEKATLLDGGERATLSEGRDEEENQDAGAKGAESAAETREPAAPRPTGKRPAAGEAPGKPAPGKPEVDPPMAPVSEKRTSAPAAAEAAALAGEFAAAARLESSAPQEALRRYLELAKRDDRWGGNALYAAARLAFDVGERPRAAALARAYLRRFPAGLNAADAHALLDALP